MRPPHSERAPIPSDWSLHSAYEQPDKMTLKQKENWERQALRQKREPPGGEAGQCRPGRMASVEPLSLKGATGDRGGRVGEGL